MNPKVKIEFCCLHIYNDPHGFTSKNTAIFLANTKKLASSSFSFQQRSAVGTTHILLLQTASGQWGDEGINKIHSVPLATEPGISLIILPLMRILQRNLTHTTDIFLFISHTTNVLLFKFRCNIFIGVRIIKEMPDSVASGTLCIMEMETGAELGLILTSTNIANNLTGNVCQGFSSSFSNGLYYFFFV